MFQGSSALAGLHQDDVILEVKDLRRRSGAAKATEHQERVPLMWVAYAAVGCSLQQGCSIPANGPMEVCTQPTKQLVSSSLLHGEHPSEPAPEGHALPRQLLCVEHPGVVEGHVFVGPAHHPDFGAQQDGGVVGPSLEWQPGKPALPALADGVKAQHILKEYIAAQTILVSQHPTQQGIVH